jgi:cytochrome c oxidase assembly protein subunit 19
MNTPRGYAPEPPARGSFPLDHEGDCKKEAKLYISCLKSKNEAHHKCKDLSKSYLECRMANGLMAPEDLNTLGYGSSSTVSR